MERYFPFLKEKGHRISLVGAGGKTTLMMELAGEYANKGYRTLVTTTTHIEKPQSDIWAKREEEMKRLWQHGKFAVAGMESEPGKLAMLSREHLDKMMLIADVVLIEADGSKRLPCKVPRDTEPVLLEVSDIVIGVMGMDSLGQPLKKVCFRKELGQKLLGVSEEHLMTEADLVQILSSETGTRKNVGYRDYFVVLNKCDDPMIRKRAARIRDELIIRGIRNVVLWSREDYQNCKKNRGDKK